MSEKIKLVLVGGGGHCRSCIDVIETLEGVDILGVIDTDPSRSSIGNYPILGDESTQNLDRLNPDYFLITVGQTKSCEKRKSIANTLKQHNKLFATIISSLAHVAHNSFISQGTIVMHRVVVNANVHIGINCIINTGAIIEHDVIVGDFCHVSTGAIVNGNCKIGKETFIGSGAVIKHGVSVCDCTIIGAGSVVVSDILESGTYVGVPARRLYE
ncbi:MAG TPA: acetyltransferase [bacterium]|nr:acetyltransferase [bacterium]HMY36422.1 acetyltransferase [bacterium]HMZ03133.1 acetyltransferase [bacterium]HNB08423.1 acetyltransferase [bacterium]HNB56687.1 acetyltransferase [bacterium]